MFKASIMLSKSTYWRKRAKVDLEEKAISVSATLDRQNYSTAVHAHGARNPVIVPGNPERVNLRWRLTHAMVRQIIGDDETEGENP